MNKPSKAIGLLVLMLAGFNSFAQPGKADSPSNSGWFSLGGRSTINLFGHDGTGLGTGGQFRIQFSNRVNTDWFADYFTIYMKEGVRSTYYHIGWSVLFYPFETTGLRKKIQPYVLAGHCFDYNKKTVIAKPVVSKDRWGSAVQAGIGTHFNLTERFDISLTSQYMIHLTKGLQAVNNGMGEIGIQEHSHAALEGHLLTTCSFNYKLSRLWKSK